MRSIFTLLTRALILTCTLSGATSPSSLMSQEPSIKLWPQVPPGRIAAQGEEADTSKPGEKNVAGKPVIRLGNVSSPMITVYAPPAEINTGAAVLVCPGGGYNILAYDLEGTEVCQWLNSIGVTAVLLKYRVPRPANEARPLEPLQDAQRALSMIRHNSAQWNVKPERIGVLGFSAGGNLAARLSNQYEQRQYRAFDEIDSVSCRPDFAVLIYPAYLVEKGGSSALMDDLPVSSQTPPTFMAMAQNDPIGPENVLSYSAQLTKSGVKAELHLYPTGGHGFGLRATEEAATTWPARCTEWLRGSGWLSK